jgi:hypothetical protein
LSHELLALMRRADLQTHWEEAGCLLVRSLFHDTSPVSMESYWATQGKFADLLHALARLPGEKRRHVAPVLGCCDAHA